MIETAVTGLAAIIAFAALVAVMLGALIWALITAAEAYFFPRRQPQAPETPEDKARRAQR